MTTFVAPAPSLTDREFAPHGLVSAALVALARRVALWERRARTRRTLAHIDPARLRDLGLSEADVRREAALPFWKG
ncbi:DUF1127 domain-containing protein [Limimaricola pyoseonensis]|uniref:Uncharacterized conserved protein YjiS, DUF1127 family n=1 Tax=Limimaricola pyoseonensis TaxID=521013 RepID=A0A1G7AHJ6_9RHOB|nr:DUF1127 domain-containing protein [Limimaricola pyoseonensis]SDE13937.1 Uncharacterized conserved protein YjiS, DUF1127 family [Limimaricola pyoseonensis]